MMYDYYDYRIKQIEAIGIGYEPIAKIQELRGQLDDEYESSDEEDSYADALTAKDLPGSRKRNIGIQIKSFFVINEKNGEYRRKSGRTAQIEFRDEIKIEMTVCPDILTVEEKGVKTTKQALKIKLTFANFRSSDTVDGFVEFAHKHKPYTINWAYKSEQPNWSVKIRRHELKGAINLSKSGEKHFNIFLGVCTMIYEDNKNLDVNVGPGINSALCEIEAEFEDVSKQMKTFIENAKALLRSRSSKSDDEIRAEILRRNSHYDRQDAAPFDISWVCPN
jgi:hypothetical protein